MTKIQQTILLIIIGVSDAYMISHSNILGKIGVRLYNYDMIKTFPSALITVLCTLIGSFFITEFLQKQKNKNWAKYLLLLFLVASFAIFLDVFIKFSAGSYAHTGKVFKFGMHLLPIVLILIFSNGLWNWIKLKKNNI